MLALSAGHNPRARGAVCGSLTEYEEAVRWVDRIEELLEGHVDVLMVPTGPLADKIEYINTVGKRMRVKLAVEIHFNAGGNGTARGSETLYCPGSAGGAKAATLVQNKIGVLMAPSRGIKEGWYKMDRPGVVDYPGDVDGDENIDAFLEDTFCTALVVEPEFIYNVDKIESCREECCQAICEAIREILL